MHNEQELKVGDLVEARVVGVIEENYHDSGYLVRIHGELVPVLKSAVRKLAMNPLAIIDEPDGSKAENENV